MVGKCRKPELTDYIVYGVADFIDKILQNAIKAEEESLKNLFLLGLGRVSCNLIKSDVNQDLCNPI